MFDFLNTRYVAREEIERHDPARRSFFNINTESDLDAARKILREIET